MKRIILSTILIMATMWPIVAKSQSATDTVPYCCNFENASERAYWRFAHNTSSSVNRWHIGIANSNGGLYGMYVSNDNGISNMFTGSTSYVYAYRRLHIPQGVYDVSYDWVANGYYSVTYGYMRAFLIPASTTITGGQALTGLSGSSIPSGAISLDGNTACLLHSSWTHFFDPIVQVPRTDDYYLVFFWYNYTSASSSYQPPAAIDNICIEPVTCPQPYNITKNNSLHF